MWIRRWVRIVVIVSASVMVLAATPTVGALDVLLVPQDFPDIQAAVDAAQDGDKIIVSDGYRGRGAVVDKSVEITGNMAVIDEGGFSRMAFVVMADGVSITNFVVEGSHLLHGGFVSGVGSLDENPHRGIVISHNTMRNLTVGVSLWGATDFEITHNTITDPLATSYYDLSGVGLFAYYGPVEDGLVAFNTISIVSDTDPGPRYLTGISLESSYEYSVQNVDVIHNKIEVDGLTLLYPPTAVLLYGRVDECSVAFNDLRGSSIPILDISTGDNIIANNRY